VEVNREKQDKAIRRIVARRAPQSRSFSKADATNVTDTIALAKVLFRMLLSYLVHRVAS